jgi:hypothetical protein
MSCADNEGDPGRPWMLPNHEWSSFLFKRSWLPGSLLRSDGRSHMDNMRITCVNSVMNTFCCRSSVFGHNYDKWNAQVCWMESFEGISIVGRRYMKAVVEEFVQRVVDNSVMSLVTSFEHYGTRVISFSSRCSKEWFGRRTGENMWLSVSCLVY